MTQRRPSRRSSKSRRGASSANSRRLQHQTLERRELLAAEIISGPRLVSVSANTGSQFDLAENNVLSVAPSEVTFRFDGGSRLDEATLQGIRFISPGDNGVFENDPSNSDDRLITPGFLGFQSDDQQQRVVVARFAETLADDRYRIQIAGYEDTNQGIIALRDQTGDAIVPINPEDPARPSVNIDFEVEVGPKVVAVIPQPITGVGDQRTQALNQIQVFFNDDPMSNPEAGVVTSNDPVVLPVVNPDFYKLILTDDTVENTDDTVFAPNLVEYDPALNIATLTYNIHPVTNAPMTDLAELPGLTGGSGTFRLRVGRGDDLPAAPATVTAAEATADPLRADEFVDAQHLQAPNTSFATGTQSILLDGGLIQSQKDVIPNWPGAYEAAGSRDYRREAQLRQQVDTTTGINIYPYNFADLYGVDSQFNQVDNAITDPQKQRAREVLQLYSERLGVQFVETEDKGLQIVTGELQAITPTADTGAGEGTPYSLFRVNERDPSRGVLVLDASETWYDGYGLSPDQRPSWFVEAIRGIGNLLGIGDLFELPDGVGAGGSSPDEPNSELFSDFAATAFPNIPSEPDFLSQSDITLGQALHRPESDDVDFYSFDVSQPGTVTAETFAQRLEDSSLLDTSMKLYRVIPASGGNPVSYELVASNDDFFSNDSLISVPLTPDVDPANPDGFIATRFIVAVSSAGNENFNGEVEESTLGGRTEGVYQLRVTFESTDSGTITDTAGSRLDGDADGREGGEFNFWFRVAGQTPNAGQARVWYVSKDDNANDLNNGTLNAPLATISRAFDLAEEDDIVRLLPSAGDDDLISTTDDNPAYEIGRGGTGDRPLQDGEVFEVPKGVTVMVDAGAILKLRTAKISVGSESTDEDRSLAAFQVLGAPVLVEADPITAAPVISTGEVYFTSFDDPTIGIDGNPLPTGPARAHWAGIEFRNDVDYDEGRPVWETEGIFLDYVSHANIQYGGGSIDTSEPAVTALQMLESRPTLIYNTLLNNASAAISADPDSFLETNFHSPRFQRAANFTSDYDRVGPEIAGNRLTNNSFNSMFIRVRTPAAGQTEPMTVSGRLDDTDIVHSISEVVTLQGNPGGPTLLETRPDVLGVSLQATMPATPSATPLTNGNRYEYVLSFVTVDGYESLVSLPTREVTAGAGGAVELSNLPTAPAEYVGRRLYRRDVNTMGVVQYEFVEQLDRRSRVFVDDGTTRGGFVAAATRPDLSAVALNEQSGATPVEGALIEDATYDYRMTFVDIYGGETLPSDPTTSVVSPVNGFITLTNLPTITPEMNRQGFVGRNLYRYNPDPTVQDYELIATFDFEERADLEGGTDFGDPTFETTFVDRGLTLSAGGQFLGRLLGPDATGGTKLQPRYDARLSIDPGIIVKSERGRIEATFGADFYAEAEDGNEIVFTSRNDDTYGAGGTFDTNNNGASLGTPGDWGGLIFRQDTTASLDHVEVRFAGGTSSVGGVFTEFNPVEILQADVRIANSTFADNADGAGTAGTRDGRGFNDPAVIFVRGSQPVILNNTIARNEGAAISINPDALNFDDNLDHGRATGVSDIIVTEFDNQGPLIEGNLLDANSLNGLRVRSEIVTTDSVWDDTGIVHVVEGEIHTLTHHYHGALRLKSDIGQSLVVKFGQDATIVGGGADRSISMIASAVPCK